MHAAQVREPALGEGAKWFKFNPQEALALLKAAGKEGLEFKMQYQSPSATTNRVEAFSQMFQQNGNLKPSLTPLDRNTPTKTESWTRTSRLSTHTGTNRRPTRSATPCHGIGVSTRPNPLPPA